MSVATVKASSTTWISQTAPGTSYMASGALRVSASGSAGAKSFVYCTVPVPPGATVSSATLTLYLVGPSSGWGTINLYRCTNRIADSAKSWTNQPSIGGIQASATPTGTIADATPVTFDVTAIVNQWASGGLPNYGLEVQQTGTSLLMFYSAHSAHPPLLTINYTTPPDTPHGLMPNGTIGVTYPVLQFGPFIDADGDALAAAQIQFAPTAAGLATPTFDSGSVSTVVPEISSSALTAQCATLSSALSTGGAIASLPVTTTTQPLASGATVTVTSGGNTQNWILTAAAAAGATSLAVASQTPNFAYPSGSTVTGPFPGFGGTALYWHVRVQDSSGQWSAYSDPAQCTVVAKPTITMSSPSPGTPSVTEVTPQIVWTAPGMTSFQVQILDALTGAILADSKHIAGTTGQWGVP